VETEGIEELEESRDNFVIKKVELHADREHIDGPSASDVEFSVTVEKSTHPSETIVLSVEVIPSDKGEHAPEWIVNIYDHGKVIWTNSELKQGRNINLNYEDSERGQKDLKIRVHIPIGARYADHAIIVINAYPENDPGGGDILNLRAEARQSLIAVKTSIGQERTVADSIESKVRGKDMGIFAVLAPAPLRGYVILEAMWSDPLKDLIKGIKKARGLVEGEMDFNEITHFLTPKPLVSGIMEGDIVELINGPFKGEKARVQSIDESKEEITVELIEAMVPIPITVRGDHVRVLENPDA